MVHIIIYEMLFIDHFLSKDSIRDMKPGNTFIMRDVVQLVIIMIIFHERKENERNDYNDISN